MNMNLCPICKGAGHGAPTCPAAEQQELAYAASTWHPEYLLGRYAAAVADADDATARTLRTAVLNRMGA